MEDQDAGKGLGALSQKLEKTKNNTQWLGKEIEKMRMLNPNSDYMTVLNSFQFASEGIQKVKETLDPMFDHYEVLPTKIVTQDKINDMTALISSNRDESLKRYEADVNTDQLHRLYGATEKDLQNSTSDHKLTEIYKKVTVRNDSCRHTCENLLRGTLEAKARKLRSKRRLKSTTSKSDYVIVNEKGYQQLIDQVYSYLKYGPSEYEMLKQKNATESVPPNPMFP